jgi:uroporphyrinogen-III synthase
MNATGAKPLEGRRVLVTRAAGQADELIALLEEAGADVVHLPAISFAPASDPASLDRVIDAPEAWDWIVFTSTNGVRFFAARATGKGLNPPTVIRAKVAAVGAATADALRALGVQPDAVPDRYRGTEIAALLPDHQTGVRTAVVRALEGREELIDELRARGGDVHVAIAYETHGLNRLPDHIRLALADGSIDTLTFTSPSTANNVLQHLSAEELSRLTTRASFVSIGPTTTGALRELGVDVVVEASESSVAALVRAVIEAPVQAP